MIKVAVLGACGKMGREVVKAVTGADDMTLVAACDVAPADDLGIDVHVDFGYILNDAKPDVIVDFAKPFVMGNARNAIQRGIVPIIGTTGLADDELSELAQLSEQKGVAAMVIPNFAIGAVLMMRFAAEAAKYMPDVEVIELHHDKKIDSPSGTAIKTAAMIDESRQAAGVVAHTPIGGSDPARGDERGGVRIHSVRLPGLVAHQGVLFGGAGQLLTIRHDSIDRTSFMPGVLLAIRQARQAKGLVYGLDQLL
ncbi:MAG: 4-hydroxy-tetrahydrodipicolinate reductase [Armatimonadetes bacterium]|nr:4-hydroxy-tetrahydrodipicolinate reductase [Armatimonadota bacterium]